MERCNTAFNEAQPSSHFSCSFFVGEIPLLQNNYLEDEVFPEIRSNMLAEKYDM